MNHYATLQLFVFSLSLSFFINHLYEIIGIERAFNKILYNFFKLYNVLFLKRFTLFLFSFLEFQIFLTLFFVCVLQLIPPLVFMFTK
jgi:hypothetical protein